jgi:hypothetical protein
MRNKRYREDGPVYCRLTYKPDDERLPVSVWAEIGPLDTGVRLFWEVDEHGKRNGTYILGFESEARTKPARYNLDTNRLERVR